MLGLLEQSSANPEGKTRVTNFGDTNSTMQLPITVPVY